MDEVLAFLKEVGTYYIATVEDGQPRVRPFGTIHLFEDKLYIQSGMKKPFYAQVLANPCCEICAFSGGQWLRLACSLVPDHRTEPQVSMLEAYPMLKSMYQADDGNNVVLFLQDCTATFSSFGADPKVITF